MTMTNRLRTYLSVLLGLIVALSSCKRPIAASFEDAGQSETIAPTPFGTAMSPAEPGPIRFGASGVGSAAFRINGSSSFPVTTTAAATITLQLISVNGVRPGTQWTFIGKSDSAVAYPTITTSGSPPGSTATFTMPSASSGTLGLAFTVKCIINGGVNDSGQTVATYSATGLVGIVNTNGEVPWSFGETLERGPIGTADMVNRQLAIGGGTGGGGSGTSIAVADLAALRAVASGSRFDGEIATVGSPLSTWVF